jgi:hypothetical protein
MLCCRCVTPDDVMHVLSILGERDNSIWLFGSLFSVRFGPLALRVFENTINSPVPRELAI